MYWGTPSGRRSPCDHVFVALRIELWEHGTLVDGVEEWWDDVEGALDIAQEDYPILDSISPYGELVLASGRLQDLADECLRLAQTANGRLEALLLRIASLGARATMTSDAELRFKGD
jgi:hypothetical protein